MEINKITPPPLVLDFGYYNSQILQHSLWRQRAGAQYQKLFITVFDGWLHLLREGQVTYSSQHSIHQKHNNLWGNGGHSQMPTKTSNACEEFGIRSLQWWEHSTQNSKIPRFNLTGDNASFDRFYAIPYVNL